MFAVQLCNVIINILMDAISEPPMARVVEPASPEPCCRGVRACGSQRAVTDFGIPSLRDCSSGAIGLQLAPSRLIPAMEAHSLVCTRAWPVRVLFCEKRLWHTLHA